MGTHDRIGRATSAATMPGKSAIAAPQVHPVAILAGLNTPPVMLQLADPVRTDGHHAGQNARIQASWTTNAITQSRLWQSETTLRGSAKKPTLYLISIASSRAIFSRVAHYCDCRIRSLQ
jgi:hypothetical protein